ncbi:hypothetical protein [Actinacidiphila paucisporea]|uniref:BON domain-containing protein n=1 Tax=Actinacidiphila paucisporea TaxID=310782 RepID=A0A1M7M3R4_9ACTN|nr:hypothetical protein [Actinacidiphila paucisporea]SHM85259.1 hypothetical protein SAMN05216499_11579 [Actinacidiphila paucisporea]
MNTSLLEYRIAGLQRRLAEDGTAELGIRVEARSGLVLVHGTVPSTACRDELLEVIAAELDGLPVRTDIALVEALAPDHPEVLS